jgi:hypothetical protein
MPMALVLVPLAAYLLLYAPGHYLLRGLATGHRGGSRLFREVLLSACCTSWIGFVLAEFSVYSLPALLSCLAVVSAAAALSGRGRRLSSYHTADLAGLVVAGLTWLWLSPPLDTRILGSDSAGYLAAGIYLSRHGSLIIHDPTIPLLAVHLKRTMFPSVGPTWGAPPYVRLFGSFILRSFDSDEVLPAFHHLLTVWVAVFHGLAGSAAAQWAITLFGGLSVWAMVEFAAATQGYLAAIIFFVLLSLSAVQSWYSRFLMPEIPAQFFLWGGLACVSFWCGTQRRADAVLAGLAFGIAGLMRIENAAFVFVALLVGLCFVEGRARRQYVWVFGCAVAVWLHATAHLFFFRTHYLGILRSLVPEAVAIFTGASWPRIAMLLACIAALSAWQYRRGFTARRGMVALAALAACVSLWGEWQHGWSGLALLKAYIGTPTLVAAGIGLAVGTTQIDRSDVAGAVWYTLVALALVQVLLAPHATPVPIWVVRRAATIVLPAACLGVAILCTTIARRWHWSAAALIVGLAMAGQFKPFAQLRWTPYYQNGLRQSQAVAAMLPEHAVLLVDSTLTGWGLAPTLWAQHDLPAYYLSRFDAASISTLLQAFNTLPVYWIGSAWAPQIPGVTVTRVGSSELALLTPTLDRKTAPGSSNQWNFRVVVYALQTAGSKLTPP